MAAARAAWRTDPAGVGGVSPKRLVFLDGCGVLTSRCRRDLRKAASAQSARRTLASASAKVARSFAYQAAAEGTGSPRERRSSCAHRVTRE